tara:strand:+ start:7500 stop:9584 length:2085 start_codon:yes stop_codon:yes gene_type:complete
MTGLLILILFLFSAYLFTCLLRPVSISELVINLFTLLITQIVISSNVLSAFQALNSINAWLYAGFLYCLISFGIIYLNNGIRFSELFEFKYNLGKIRSIRWKDFTYFELLVFVPLILTLSVVGILNLILIVNVAPGNMDSMTTHLTRVAYYLQQGSFQFYEANNWGQVLHPRNAISLYIFTFLVSGSEKLTQLVQFSAYWVTLISIYGISMQAGMARKESLFSGLVSGLLISLLMQSTTTQSDLLITALIGVNVYYLLTYKKTGQIKFLGLASLPIALALGMKASVVLAVLPTGILAIYCFLNDNNTFEIRRFINYSVFVGISVILLTITSGYVTNIQKFEHPLGPEEVRDEHTFENESPKYILINGARNSLRYGLDFITLDGLPTISVVRSAQRFLRLVSEKEIEETVYIEDFSNSDDPADFDRAPEVSYSGDNEFIHFLMDDRASRVQYDYFKLPVAHEDLSYWGILGFGFIWFTLLYSIFSKKSPVPLKILAAASILFFLLQSFAGPYDPWRGRYFNIMAVFALPSAGLIFRTHFKIIKSYFLIVLYVGCLSALTAVILRLGSPMITYVNEARGIYYSSILSSDRAGQVTRQGDFQYPVRLFNDIVPADAKVAVFVNGHSIEYQLFGENLSRTLYPINSFLNGVQPIPAGAEYLIYDVNYPCPDFENDRFLGGIWYLREITTQNRNCSEAG